MQKTKQRLGAAHARYKNNLDARLQKHPHVVTASDYVFLRFEWNNVKGHSHRIAPVVAGLIKVTTNDDKKVFI